MDEYEPSLNCYNAGSLRHSLQDRLSKAGSSGKGRPDEINVKLSTSTGTFVVPLVLNSCIAHLQN